jgi:hypothetical protein
MAPTVDQMAAFAKPALYAAQLLQCSSDRLTAGLHGDISCLNDFLSFFSVTVMYVYECNMKKWSAIICLLVRPQLE